MTIKQKQQQNVIIFFIVLGILVFGLSQSLTVHIDEEDVIYSYHGELPRERNIKGVCVIPQEFFNAGVVTENNLVLSNSKSININGFLYEFVTQKIGPISLISDDDHLCAGMSYETKVLKDGLQIDTISVPQRVEACADSNSRVERFYGGVKVSFGFDSNLFRGGNFCPTWRFAVVHKYENPGLTETICCAITGNDPELLTQVRCNLKSGIVLDDRFCEEEVEPEETDFKLTFGVIGLIVLVGGIIFLFLRRKK